MRVAGWVLVVAALALPQAARAEGLYDRLWLGIGGHAGGTGSLADFDSSNDAVFGLGGGLSVTGALKVLPFKNGASGLVLDAHLGLRTAGLRGPVPTLGSVALQLYAEDFGRYSALGVGVASFPSRDAGVNAIPGLEHNRIGVAIPFTYVMTLRGPFKAGFRAELDLAGDPFTGKLDAMLLGAVMLGVGL